MARILFAEAHRGFRQSASMMLGRQPDLEIMARVGTVAEGRRRLVREMHDATLAPPAWQHAPAPPALSAKP